MSELKRVLICGTDDLASAVAIRLYRSGLHPILLSSERPLDIHYQRTYSGAVYAGSKAIDQVTSWTVAGLLQKGDINPAASIGDFIHYVLANRNIPILSNNELKSDPSISVDYIFISDAELFLEIPVRISDAPVIIAPADMGVFEQSRYRICRDFSCLGSVIYPFNRERFVDCTKDEPQSSDFETVRAPLEGVFTTDCTLDDLVHEKQELGRINDIPILSPLSGRITGLLNSGMIIKGGTLFAEVCPVSQKTSAKRISTKSFAVAGGVLEAILYDIHLENH